MKNYFENIETLQELKTAYRKLAKQFHPDANNGNDEDFKEIGNQYTKAHTAIERGQNKNRKDVKSDSDIAQDIEMFMNILDKIINIPTIKIEICGYWLWVDIDKEYKDELKNTGLGFKWSPKKKRWYWRDNAYKTRYNTKGLSMQEIRLKYGSAGVETNERKALNN
jgi:DnaJ-class molecular chaperone with C-terminal Zn finger domain